MPRGFGGGGFGRGGFGTRRGGRPLIGMGGMGMGMGMGPLLTGLMGGGLGYLLGSNTNEQVPPKVQQVAPAAPQPVTCPYCSRSYLPAENNFACPGCGAPAPTGS
jgi:hypothetical protein